MAGYDFSILRVLVADDNPHMVALVRTLLRAVQVKDVIDARDGAQALDVLSTEDIDIVITDLRMEPMDGVAFTRALRRESAVRDPRVPIIMMTAVSDRPRVIAARDAGINEFLAKPISPRSLLDRLVAVINHPRPFVRSQNYVGPCRRRRGATGGDTPKRRWDDNPDAEVMELG